MQPLCANAVAGPLHGQTTVVRRRGLGPDQEEQRTQRASFVGTYHPRARSKQQSVIVLGSDAWLRICHVKRLRTTLRGQTRVSQPWLGCLSPGPGEVHLALLFAAPDTVSSSRRWLEFSESKDLTAESHDQTTE